MSKNLIIDGLDLPNKFIVTNENGEIVSSDYIEGYSFGGGVVTGLPAGASWLNGGYSGVSLGNLLVGNFNFQINVGITALNTVPFFTAKLSNDLGLSFSTSTQFITIGYYTEYGNYNNKALACQVNAYSDTIDVIVRTNGITETSTTCYFYGNFYARINV